MRGYMSFVEREDTPELHKLAELGVFLMNCVVELFFQRTAFILASNNPFYYLSEDAMKDVRVASRNEYLCEPIQMLGSWLSVHMRLGSSSTILSLYWMITAIM